MTGDTICASATPAGVAPRAVIRTSGTLALSAARTLCGFDPPVRRVTACDLHLDGLRVPATVYAFAGPASHTGEDVAEYHVPGSPLVLRLVLDALRVLGLRDAAPGEFTARAYLNGKTPLDRAEAVQMLIAAENDADLQAAHAMRDGAVADATRPALDGVADLLALFEAAMDFSDQPDVVILTPHDARTRLSDLLARTETLRTSATRRGTSARPTVVLVGRPNAGKSTLFNALVGRERVVVSNVAGTTRDAVSADVTLGGVDVTLIDLPGVAAFEDPLDAQAARRAARVADAADLRVVLDPDGDFPAAREPALRVRSRRDPSPRATGICAATGGGLADFSAEIGLFVTNLARGPGVLFNDRHADCLARAADALRLAVDAAGEGDELAAALVREALDALGEVHGVVTPDDVLGRVFAGFCLGK